jgi:hypothetical protein
MEIIVPREIALRAGMEREGNTIGISAILWFFFSFGCRMIARESASKSWFLLRGDEDDGRRTAIQARLPCKLQSRG